MRKWIDGGRACLRSAFLCGWDPILTIVLLIVPFLFRDITKDLESSSARTHTLPLWIRQDHISCLLRQEPFLQTFLDLPAIHFRLILVGCGEDDIIPLDKMSLGQATFVVHPGVLIRLA